MPESLLLLSYRICKVKGVLPVNLRDILAKELFLFQELLAMEEKAYTILIEGEAKSLEVLNLQKGKLIQEVDRLEKERINLIPMGMTLKEYLKENPFEAEELQNLRKALLQVHQSLKRIQKINRHLINHNLKFMEYAFSCLFPERGEKLYVSSGEMRQKSSFSGIINSNA